MRLARRALAALLSATLIILAWPLPSAVSAQDAPQFAVEAKSAILLDFNSKTLLYELNPDQQIPPASLTKLMTIWIASKALRDGRIKETDVVNISRNAWFANPEFGGASGMFLEPGQHVTVAEIMKGIAIVSGNDACVAMAEHMAGTVDAFVAMMNDEARELGLEHTHFVDPHGLSPKNITTARDMLKLAQIYIENFPENLAKLHSQKTFTYPLPENLSENQKARGDTRSFTQENYNKLLFDPDLAVDGLKTGFISVAGYNYIVTATEGDRRLIGVLLGTKSEAARAAQGKALLLYGFRNFETVTPLQGTEQLGEIKVWKGAANLVHAIPAHPITLTLPKGHGGRIQQEVQVEPELIAPVEKGRTVGSVVLRLDGREVGRTNLVAAEEVPRGGWWKRLVDSVRLFFRSLAGRFSKNRS